MSIAEDSVADVANMEDLFRRCLGNLDLVERVLQAFESHFEGDLKELEIALEGNCYERVAQLSHRMKGACANVAAVSMARELAAMERFARDEQQSASNACMERLREEWRRFVTAEKDLTGMLVPSY
jgi:HPt (histidine-containing phosphotransfer) domain-containing protein